MEATSNHIFIEADGDVYDCNISQDPGHDTLTICAKD